LYRPTHTNLSSHISYISLSSYTEWGICRCTIR